MKTRIYRPLFLMSMMGMVVALACATLVATPTASIPASETPEPTATRTARPTSTPRPSNTPVPTPAAVGSPVSYKSLEITVVGVLNRESVHFGDISGNWETFYTPNEGNFIIDVGVRVTNHSDSPVLIPWEYIYILEENGSGWYPSWGKARVVERGKSVDPFTIGLSSTALDGSERVRFEKDTYLRLIFGVTADPDQTILFGIEDSPMIAFQVE